MYIMKECQDELTCFLLLTFWVSDKSLEKYTGTDNEVVNPAPEERDLLVVFESTTRRYQVIGIKKKSVDCNRISPVKQSLVQLLKEKDVTFN